MPYDERLAERVRALLSGHRDVAERKLSGTLAFSVAGALCCAVGEEGLLLRVRPEERSERLRQPHVKPARMGARTMSGFVRVEGTGLRTKAALSRWLQLGIASARPTARR